MRLGLHSLSKLVVSSNSGDKIPVSILRLTVGMSCERHYRSQPAVRLLDRLVGYHVR